MKLEEYPTALLTSAIFHAGLTLSIAAEEQPHTLPSPQAGSPTVLKVTKVGGCMWDHDQFCGGGGSAVPSARSYRYTCKIKPTQWEVVEGELETHGMYGYVAVGTTGSYQATRHKNSEQRTARITHLSLVTLQSAVL